MGKKRNHRQTTSFARTGTRPPTPRLVFFLLWCTVSLVKIAFKLFFKVFLQTPKVNLPLKSFTSLDRFCICFSSSLVSLLFSYCFHLFSIFHNTPSNVFNYIHMGRAPNCSLNEYISSHSLERRSQNKLKDMKKDPAREWYFGYIMKKYNECLKNPNYRASSILYLASFSCWWTTSQINPAFLLGSKFQSKQDSVWGEDCGWCHCFWPKKRHLSQKLYPYCNLCQGV